MVFFPVDPSGATMEDMPPNCHLDGDEALKPW